MSQPDLPPVYYYLTRAGADTRAGWERSCCRGYRVKPVQESLMSW